MKYSIVPELFPITVYILLYYFIIYLLYILLYISNYYFFCYCNNTIHWAPRATFLDRKENKEEPFPTAETALRHQQRFYTSKVTPEDNRAALEIECHTPQKEDEHAKSSFLGPRLWGPGRRYPSGT